MVSSVVASLLGGFIVDRLGADAVAVTAVAVGVVGCVIIYIFAKDKKQV